eukprot:2829853-Amphidinium_carterae.1
MQLPFEPKALPSKLPGNCSSYHNSFQNTEHKDKKAADVSKLDCVGRHEVPAQQARLHCWDQQQKWHG